MNKMLIFQRVLNFFGICFFFLYNKKEGNWTFHKKILLKNGPHNFSYCDGLHTKGELYKYLTVFSIRICDDLSGGHAENMVRNKIILSKNNVFWCPEKDHTTLYIKRHRVLLCALYLYRNVDWIYDFCILSSTHTVLSYNHS